MRKDLDLDSIKLGDDLEPIPRRTAGEKNPVEDKQVGVYDSYEKAEEAIKEFKKKSTATFSIEEGLDGWIITSLAKKYASPSKRKPLKPI